MMTGFVDVNRPLKKQKVQYLLHFFILVIFQLFDKWFHFVN